MQADWKKWMNDHSNIFADVGAGVGKTKAVTQKGISDRRNEVMLYSVVQNPDEPFATETMEHRRRIEAADARFRATLRRALQRGEETLQGCVGRHERLRNFSQPPAPGRKH